MKVTSKVNKTNLKALNDMMFLNLVKAVDSMQSDIKKSKIMPFDTGNLQNKSMFVNDRVKRFVLLQVDAPYARKIYFHPEYNFKKDKNPNAQGLWFEPYINGTKKLFVNMAFAKFMRKDLKRYASKGN